MSWVIAIIIAVLQVLLPVLMKAKFSRTSEDGQRQPELRERLQARVRSRWGRVAAPLLMLGLTALLLGGCALRTIYVPTGEPVRLRETVRAKVWVLDASGKPVAGEMNLPEGWYALPVPESSAATPGQP